MFYILGAILWIVFAFWPAIVARRKGYSFVLFFLLSLVLFFVALIIAYALRDKTKTATYLADEKAAEAALAHDEGR